MPVKIDYDTCESCVTCFEVCQQNCFDNVDGKPVVAREGDCIECGLCISECPVEAISWIKYNTVD